MGNQRKNPEVWSHYIKLLKAYKKQYGDFSVPSQWKKDRQFSQWVENISKHPERVPPKINAELQKMGFDFNPVPDWDSMFFRLKVFFEEHGHSYIPPNRKDLEYLFDWTIRQKQLKAILTAQQVKKLNSVDFDWNVSDRKMVAWEMMYKELENFKTVFGHVKVPQDYRDNLKLGGWVAHQRKNKTEGKLSRERIKKLNLLGFLWKEDIERMRHVAWEKQYNELVKYKKDKGHIDRFQIRKANYSLGLWVETQMVSKDRMPSYRKKKLNAIGFQWDKGNFREERWNDMYERLQMFKAKHGHTRVKRSDDFKLSVWLQRNKRDKDKIDKTKRKKLEQLGIKWPNELFRELWEKHFEHLKQFRKKHGHINVSKSNRQLYEWVQDQKKLRTENRMPKDREAKLKDIGFIWAGEIDKQKTKLWETQYERFKQLKKEHGEKYHISLKQQPDLARWFNRQIHSKEKLSAWKKEKLNAINFPWRVGKRYRMELWERMYDQLRAYKKQHGHCDVPQKYNKNQPLASWVSGQRIKKLSPEQKEKLNTLGFSWAGETAEKRWSESLQELLALKQKNKLHTLKPGMPLYSWLYQQKKNFHKRPEHKKKMLLKLGLDPTGDTLLGNRASNKSITLWEEKYRRLAAFKKRFGHCAVPGKWQEDPLLGRWVAFQRRLFKFGRLLPERIKKLNDLDFDWSRQ
jgi:hypothetical protein